jgi:hypothetical protein
MGRKELDGRMWDQQTQEGDMGCPGIDSNQMPMIRSLHNSINNNIWTNLRLKDLLKQTLMDLPKSDP